MHEATANDIHCLEEGALVVLLNAFGLLGRGLNHQRQRLGEGAQDDRRLLELHVQTDVRIILTTTSLLSGRAQHRVFSIWYPYMETITLL